MSFIYLASPYTNPDNPSDLAYREQRYREVCMAAAALMLKGEMVFSPIAHSHPIAAYLPDDLRNSHTFWLEQDFAILGRADKLVICQLYQWERSYGVQKEIDFAFARHIPVEFLPRQADQPGPETIGLFI